MGLGVGGGLTGKCDEEFCVVLYVREAGKTGPEGGHGEPQAKMEDHAENGEDDEDEFVVAQSVRQSATYRGKNEGLK